MSHVPPPWQPAPPPPYAGQFPAQPGGFPPPASGQPTWAGQFGAPPQPPRRPLIVRVWRWINPASAAKVALQAQNRLAPPDPKIERVRLIRTLLGMAVVGWVALKYDSVEADEVFSQAILHVTISVMVAVLAVPITALALVLLTDSAKRRETRRSMRYPMKSMGAFIGAGATLAALTFAGIVEMRPGGALMVLVVLGWLLLIWCGFFAITAFFMVPRHLFAAADGHLLMPCLLAPTLSWAIAVVDLASPGDERVPAVVAAIVTLGAPVSITAMSVWEAKRVKELYGVTFRSGSQPIRFPAPPAPAAPATGAGSWLPNQAVNASWSTAGGQHTYVARPFPHTVHVIALLLSCGMWSVGYLIAYLLWRRRQAAPAAGGWV
ncbi:hypothetical protein LO772_04745 [Yinghuangia sp. ASG 101]|uniref:hypothetical protein n=1 Tax=Yinghuangia sp. ASG 101 TaxID=2896848 RepID=UPI001E4D7EEF|nr:hypothetical protein [Yinghuangia sp. ASG 101]UGQ12932.1 hypothetical protein LO772_04745 [Yinghuangia sp. ASG 101]